MLILAIDTAGLACAACLYDNVDDAILAEKSEMLGKGHAERLIGMIEEILQEANLALPAIDRIVTAVGPGSFAGIRVAVATARGLSLALKIPVIGVSNLEALLETSKMATSLADFQPPMGAALGAVMNAGRDMLYCQFNFKTAFADENTAFIETFDNLAASAIFAPAPVSNQAPDNIAVSENQQTRLCLCGDAAQKLQTRFPQIEVLQETNVASIKLIARLGSQKPDTLKKPEPLYLRKPDAKPQAGFSLPHADKS